VSTGGRVRFSASRWLQRAWRPSPRLATTFPSQPPFDESARGGDCSYRIIEQRADLHALRIDNRSDAFDPSGPELDKNLALPLDRLHELVSERAIGDVAPRHFSIMGSITAPGKLVSRTAPEIAAMLRQDAVDAVLLVPV
jgi:D-proline reductase (dithiol) PrdB